MIRRFDEGMHLPHLVGGEAQAEGRHLRALAAVDHGLQESLVGEPSSRTGWGRGRRRCGGRRGTWLR